MHIFRVIVLGEEKELPFLHRATFMAGKCFVVPGGVVVFARPCERERERVVVVRYRGGLHDIVGG